MTRVLLVVLFAVLFGCDECDLNEFRCKGDVLQQCDAKGRWVEHTDCSDLDWECCEGDDGLNCYPEPDCIGGDA